MVYINEMLGATFHKKKCMKALKPELISLQEFKRFLRFLESEQCGWNSRHFSSFNDAEKYDESVKQTLYLMWLDS